MSKIIALAVAPNQKTWIKRCKKLAAEFGISAGGDDNDDASGGANPLMERIKAEMEEVISERERGKHRYILLEDPYDFVEMLEWLCHELATAVRVKHVMLLAANLWNKPQLCREVLPAPLVRRLRKVGELESACFNVGRAVASLPKGVAIELEQVSEPFLIPTWLSSSNALRGRLLETCFLVPDNFIVPRLHESC